MRYSLSKCLVGAAPRPSAQSRFLPVLSASLLFALFPLASVHAALVNVSNPANLLAGKTVAVSSQFIDVPALGVPGGLVDELAADGTQDAPFIFGWGADQRLSISGFNATFNTVRMFMVDNDPGRVFQTITLKSSTTSTNSLDPNDYETVLGTFSPARRIYTEYAGSHRVYFDLSFPAAPTGTRSLFFQSTTPGNGGGRIYEIQAFEQEFPTISIAPSGSNVLVTWSAGTLETSTDFVLWSAVPGAVSPLEVFPTEPVRFFGPVPGSQGTIGGKPAVRLETGATRAEITALGWDTEGSAREKTNLLRPQTMAGLRIRSGGQWRNGIDLPTQVDASAGNGKTYWLRVASGAELNWVVESDGNGLTMHFSSRGTNAALIEGVELVFPFAPGVTPVTAISGDWNTNGTFQLPAVLSAPDFGQMRLTASSTAPNRAVVRQARLEGSRAAKAVNLVLELTPPPEGVSDTLEFAPHLLAPPAGLADTSMWIHARRGWFNSWQPSAQWGDQGNPFSAPAGMLANNVISDPASCSLWFYADQAFWTPEVAPGVSIMPLVRRTIEYWLSGSRLKPTGEVVCYWDKLNFLDANAGPLIASWDYVEATGDTAWLGTQITKLELVAEFLAGRDIDNDGLVEATQSGNRNTLIQPLRSCAWFDALNCGHKDAYCNALIYRAWRCLADLEAKLGRSTQQARYAQLADRLKAAYVPTLYNPATGWLAWWKSADGELHDYAAPTVNGLAIEYGLVEPAQGREILARLRAKMAAVGFTRFDLGVPPMLVPVLRADYLQVAIGTPQREDGTDTFGQYMNGGITAGQVLHFLAAHYVVGEPGPADAILRAMLARQGRGGFQNGVRDAWPQGIDFTTWDGQPSGYEGYLADSFRFLQAVLLREAAFRNRLYRPLQ